MAKAKPHRVLVVDDDMPIADAVKIILELRGYHVWAAYDGQRAMEILQKIAPNLVLLDVMLPGVTGLELCRFIKSKLPHIKVVMLSAKGLRPDLDKAENVGADAYLTKPCKPDEILDAVNRLLSPE
jgi:CheY-like chemotaxis protein